MLKQAAILTHGEKRHHILRKMSFIKKAADLEKHHTAFACSKSIVSTPEQCVRFVFIINFEQI